jgi:crossover junction endodeoxyribonuclease RuvC
MGVDPGIRGAIAVYDADAREIKVIDFPLVDTKAVGRKQIRYEINENALSDWVINNADGMTMAYVEKVGAMPKQGVSSMFRFGMSYGIIRGILAARGIGYQLVSPRKWKGPMGLGTNKDEARLIASRLFPSQASLFQRKKDANRAEAVLIAVYGHKFG